MPCTHITQTLTHRNASRETSTQDTRRIQTISTLYSNICDDKSVPFAVAVLVCRHRTKCTRMLEKQRSSHCWLPIHCCWRCITLMHEMKSEIPRIIAFVGNNFRCCCCYDHTNTSSSRLCGTARTLTPTRKVKDDGVCFVVSIWTKCHANIFNSFSTTILCLCFSHRFLCIVPFLHLFNSFLQTVFVS